MDFHLYKDCFVDKIQLLTQVYSSKSQECIQSACPCRCSYSEQLPPTQRGQTDGPLWVLRGESLHTCDDLGTPGTSANTARDGGRMLSHSWDLYQINALRIQIICHHLFFFSARFYNRQGASGLIPLSSKDKDNGK